MKRILNVFDSYADSSIMIAICTLNDLRVEETSPVGMLENETSILIACNITISL